MPWARLVLVCAPLLTAAACCSGYAVHAQTKLAEESTKEFGQKHAENLRAIARNRILIFEHRKRLNKVNFDDLY